MKVTNMYDKAFWQETAVRAMNTFFQGFLGVISANAVFLSDINFKVSLSAGAFAAVIFVAKQLSVPPAVAAYSARRALE